MATCQLWLPSCFCRTEPQFCKLPKGQKVTVFTKSDNSYQNYVFYLQSQFSPKETNFTNKLDFYQKSQFLPNVTNLRVRFDFLTFYNCVQLHSVIKEYLAPTLTNTRCEALTLTPIVTSIQVGGCGHEGFCLPHSLQNMHRSGF